ncbi:MAG: 30S ribosomal protein S12 methylthiotransferase RimO, partial [Oscillospiraceae bacterium]|nr:30S ribosomal protein S12 methylthiotransferase RimO [Oscillospiraceae bacterium]
RKGGTAIIKDAVARLRKAIPHISIRTTLITGYPGETQEEFSELYEFVKETKFERLGCFAYSEEDGTVAAKMENQIDTEIRQQRADAIMLMQTDIMANCQAKLVDKEIDVIVDDYDSENGIWICRSVYDAPEIDGEVYIDGDSDVEMGDIVRVKVIQSDIYDLYAELV